MPSEATRAKELAGLIERLEKATGPDGAIDDLLYWTLKQHPAKGPFARIPAYTASVDAALALVERVLPDSTYGLLRIRIDEAHVTFKSVISLTEAWKDSAPLAILLALLRALQESQDAQ